MAQLELAAQRRKVIGKKVKQLRQTGLVPAVLYGSTIGSQPLQIEQKLLRRVIQTAGMNQLIALKVGRKKPVLVLARDIQRDVIRQTLVHVDFQQVVMTDKITTEVPVQIVGEAPAIQLGGVLVQGLNTIQVECLPGDLISSVEVDVSHLAELHASVNVSDLSLPATITVLSDPDSFLARVEPPRKIEELEEVEEVEEEGEFEEGEAEEDADRDET
jgi:large subunit ribosomal protein L25